SLIKKVISALLTCTPGVYCHCIPRNIHFTALRTVRYQRMSVLVQISIAASRSQSYRNQNIGIICSIPMAVSYSTSNRSELEFSPYFRDVDRVVGHNENK